MRVLFTLLCLGLATPVLATTHLPLIVLESRSFDQRLRAPLITIGTLPAESLPQIPDRPQTFTSGEHLGLLTFPDHNGDITDAIGRGKIQFGGPIAGRTLLFLAAPMLNIKQSWVPTAITLDERTVTLEITAWDGELDVDTGKNFSCRATYLISLAALPQGDYRLHLHCTHLAEQPDHRYVQSGIDDASTAFTISAGGAKEGAPATVAESALKSTAADRKAAAVEFIPPSHWARDDSRAKNGDRPAINFDRDIRR